MEEKSNGLLLCSLAGYNNIHPVVAVASKKKLTEKINRRKFLYKVDQIKYTRMNDFFAQKRVKKILG